MIKMCGDCKQGPMLGKTGKPLLSIVILNLLLLPAKATGAQEAYALYNQHKYAAAADSFERLIRTSPSPSLCYYAALSNKACGKSMRAQQLFKYIASNYPDSAEAKYARQILSQGAQSQPAESTTDLPDSVKNTLSPEMQRLLSSPLGKKAVEQVMREKSSEISVIKKAEQKGLMNQEKVTAAVQQVGITDGRSHGDKDHAFTAGDIARDGAAGIDQTRYPNCWFEASMAALAELPRGQRLIASMIRKKESNDYIVRFPNDGVEYAVTAKDLLVSGIKDKALWASIIECAEIKKFPDNKGAEGAGGDQSRLEVGLQCITGCKAEIVYPRNASVQELSSFIGGAIKSQNPVVAGTFNASHFDGPIIVFPLHAYTVVGFDPTRNMVTLRNPHGLGSQQFELPEDPKHEEFEQLDGGLCKMSLTRFQKCFHSVARSFI